MKRSDKTSGIKAWAWALVMGAFALSASSAYAGFTKTGKITSNARKLLNDQTVYVPDNNLTVKGSSGLSGLYLLPNTTAVLYIPSGVTLKVQGGSGSEMAGAGAGIEIPDSSTLIITGGGTLEATGGKGASGSNAEDGADAYVDTDDDEYGRAGYGGAGGNGGGGAGAGIGGNGGRGGAGGARCSGKACQNKKTDHDDYDQKAISGNSGATGSVGSSMGRLFVLGSVKVTGTAGGEGSSGGGSGSKGKFAIDYYWYGYSYRAGGGGGGGGGGKGAAAAYGIGGGGGGGGGGGSGGEGARYCTTQGYTERSAKGGYGGGGSAGGSGSRTEGESAWYVGRGGDGGYGGSRGSGGANGAVYKSAAATVNGAPKYFSSERHPSIEYNLKFDDDWRIASNITVKLGYACPRSPIAQRYGYKFKGWYTGRNGLGTRYYDEDGNHDQTTWKDDIWSFPSDITLYPKWEENSQEPLDEVTLYVNGTKVVEGVDVSGTGWQYSSKQGAILLYGKGGTYDIRGKDIVGFASVRVVSNCTVQVSQTLEMSSTKRNGYSPIVLERGVNATLDVNSSSVKCSLKGSSGCTSILVPSTASLTVKTTGVLEVEGGDGAADMGVNKGDGEGGSIYVETYTNWAANIRPGHGSDDNNGLLNSSGKGAKYYSYPASNRVWSVRMMSLGFDQAEKTMYLQRVPVDVDIHDSKILPDSSGIAWVWTPTGGWEWAMERNASISSNNLWVASVNDAHSQAEYFTPLHIEIDGEDIAHLTGPGWYATRTGGTATEGAKASLVITNGANHFVTGYGNANIDIRCDMTLVISNLSLNVASVEGKCAMWLADGVTLNLVIQGEGEEANSLISSPDAPGIAVYQGRTLNISGDGALSAQGGKNAAGIGGGRRTPASGTINISGGVIMAIGGANAAGIGGGQTSSAIGDITITGGWVTARGGQYAAGIGGGHTGYANVRITGGTVFPTPGSKASAIGRGFESAAGSPVSEFGIAAIYTTLDGVSPAAVNGSGKTVFPVQFEMGVANAKVTGLVIQSVEQTVNDLWTDESGNLKLWLESTDGKLHTITVTVSDENGDEKSKSWGYKVSDTGDYEFSDDVLTVDGKPVTGGVDTEGTGWKYSAGNSLLVFSSGNHTISGNSTNGTINVVVKGDGIGITIDKLTLETTRSEQSPFVVSNRCTLTLSGDNTIECLYNPNASSVNRMGSQYTAAVEVPRGASLVINGEGSLVAIGGIAGAGIGSRGKKLNAGSIIINGGIIYATGGWGKTGGGAGIGGGTEGGVESIVVSNGYVCAKGGKNACGIGMGYNGPKLSDGTFRVTGGTVLAEKGEGQDFSDFVTSPGGGVDPTWGRSIVIDGGSVRPRNAIVENENPDPNPVNSDGERLVYAVIENLAPAGNVDTVTIKDTLWTQYDGVDIVSDEDGCLCLWGVQTNASRFVELQSPNLDGGYVELEINAASNTITKASSTGAIDYRIVDGVTNWCVEVHALPASKRMVATGDVTNYVHGTIMSDYTGKTYLYLPDGEYDFAIGGYSYHAVVDGDRTVATYTVGILVNNVDIGAESGDGWSYNGTEETLTLTDGMEYLIVGTNSERKVSVCAAAADVKVRCDRLALKAASKGSFYFSDEFASLEFVGGTVSSSKVSDRCTVSGGSFGMELRDAVAPSGEAAYRVTIGGFKRYGQMDIKGIEENGVDCLAGYDTTNIWADANGMVYLYLPDGDYYFWASDGTSAYEIVAVVDGDETTAVIFEPTGVAINGRDAARLRGDGWRNEDGMVSLTAATNYVIAGTNSGSAITIKALKSNAALVFDNLVMTNEMMLATPIAFDIAGLYSVELVGTNVLKGVDSGFRGMEMAAAAEVTVTGDGFLSAQGGDSAPGIGIAKGDDPSSASFVLKSGEVVAQGGLDAAGVGGGYNQNAIKVYVYGGVLTAVGGNKGAGIGGGCGDGSSMKRGTGSTVCVYGGKVIATGGESASGIGGGFYGGGGQVTITNGMVFATGGLNASGIGGGYSGKAGTYSQSGGTVVAVHGSGGMDIGPGYKGGASTATSTRITGGSLNAASVNMPQAPVNGTGESVYCVTIPTGRPNFDVGAVMGSYNGYSLAGVWTDDEGKIYLWLPNGKYYLNIGRIPFRAVVNGADTEAVQWSAGVFVNGEDVALQSGEGWTYDPFGYALSVTNDGCVVSGTNTSGEVYLDCSRDIAVTVSNLVLTTSLTSYSPIEIAASVNAVVTLVGENTLTSPWSGSPAISVPYTAKLTMNGIDTLVPVPDLDDIKYYTNTVENIEEIDDGQGNVEIVTNYVDIVTVVTNYNYVLTAPILSASGGYEAAGIGGGYHLSHGTIEITGGDIRATGGDAGAGIGSGAMSESDSQTEVAERGTIRISGGKVTATGGRYASGIGGGNRHTGGTIEISGGEVKAYGDQYGSGIGGGYFAHGYRVTISGGKVEAYGGEYGAGIGDGYSNILRERDPAQVSISGGQVTAVGGTGAAGIGAGYADAQCAVVGITGGTVVATGGDAVAGRDNPDDIGFGSYTSYEKQFFPLTIKEASVHATHRTGSNEYVKPAPSNDTERVWCVAVETSKTNELVVVELLNGFDDGSDIYADADGKIYLWLPNGNYLFCVDHKPYTATVADADATAERWFSGVTADGVDIAAMESEHGAWGYNIVSKTLYVAGDCVISGTNTSGYVNILASTTNALSFTISNLCLKATSNTKASPISVTYGTVTVCLAGTNTLDASATDDYAGLNVVPPATLVVTNLEESATLLAYSGEDAAAIGGNQGSKSNVDSNTGTIRINGGRIVAQAKDSGAGIGSGYRGTSGDIYISGGLIQAFGGEYSLGLYSYWLGAGIGGGTRAYSGSKIVISGGTVRIAKGGRAGIGYAADIGPGYDGYGAYSVEISGGSVYPVAYNDDKAFNQSESDTVYYPSNSDKSRVFRTTLSGFTPDAKVDLRMDGYGSNDIYTDANGKIYLWLANGEYYYSVGGRRFAMKMDNGTVTTVEIPDSYGVEVDGVDVANLWGEGWSYKVFDSRLDVTNACVISGTNTEGKVNISVDAAEEFALTISNLCLKTTSGSPITILHGTNTLCLVGTNTLDAADAAGYPGLHVASMYEGVVITNLHDGAKLVARGGENAAGIGADNDDVCGNIEIAGGIIEATGGVNGAGIGGSQKYGFVGVFVRGGTVRPVAGAGSVAIGYGSSVSTVFGSENIVFAGGSVATDYASVEASMGVYVVNDDGTKVYPVELSGFVPNERADIEIDGYGTYDIYADSEGKIYPWLWESDYVFVIRGVPYRAHVTTSGAVSEPWLSGVTVDGTDVAYLHDESGKWNYRAADRTLYISSGTSPDDCVTVTGTNTESYVHVAATSGIYFAISNLCLVSSNAAPVSVSAQNATVTVAFAGTNTLDATQASRSAGLRAGSSSSSHTYLSLTNLEESAVLVAKGGSGGAGIGGGWCNPDSVNGVYVTIYGGKITATGGSNASGIGGGGNGNAEVNIYGGEIKATGGSSATGIGSGSGSTGSVNIWGGIIDATSGSGTAAGIGSGGSSYAYVYIYGGLVKAESRGSGMAIGAGNYSMGYVYISGGTVVPKPYTAYATSKSIGSTRDGYGEVRFTGGSINTTTNLVSPAAENESHAAVWPVTVTGLKARSEIAIDGLPSNYGTKGIYSDEAGEITLWLPNGDYVFTTTDDDGTGRGYIANVSDGPTDAAGFAFKGFTVNGVDIGFLGGDGWSYLDDDSTGRIVLSGSGPYDLSGTLTNKFLVVSNSCSIVLSNVVLRSYNVYGQPGIVNIAGAYDVDMSIFGDNMVTTAVSKIAGIRVSEGASLAIDGSGSLTAYAGEYAAGIGGGYDAGCGSIAINGGTVTATGGRQGAGIGGGGFTGGTSVGGTYGGDITITGGVVVATGGDWAAGIGGGEQSSGGSVVVTGGRITAQGGVHGPAIGACGAEGTYGDVTISGGTIATITDEYRRGLGRGRDTVSMGAVTIAGGSVAVATDKVDPAPSNTSQRVYRVDIPGLTPDAKVAFDGLPDYYGKTDVYADVDGKVYLWLPESWPTPSASPLLFASPKKGKGLLAAHSGTEHTFAANGYSYSVAIDSSTGGAVAEKGEPLELSTLTINDFAVDDGCILINVMAAPDTWLYGFAEQLSVYASATLPIPDTEESKLDLSEAEYYLEPDGSATIIAPVDNADLRFFKVRK